MEFSLEQRTASLSIGEFAGFSLGPRDAGEGTAGIWRAQLGTHWHQQLRLRATEENPGATFEIPITGKIFHQGWTVTLTGRIDQLAVVDGVTILREIKTVTRTLPMDESELRADYPSYFAQLASYLALRRIEHPGAALRGELVFVETASGLAQSIGFTPADDATFRVQLARFIEFLNLRLRARERLRHLRFRPPFTEFRPGQEDTAQRLQAALHHAPAALFFEAPTGFGKTGMLLETALTELRAGHFERVLYLTSKATGQLQVVRTLQTMTSLAESNPIGYFPASAGEEKGTAVAAWHVRNKGEHCINTTFHCVRDACGYIDDLEKRWPQSGLARFYLLENQANDLDTLRAAGRAARICPYEITRSALPFNDVWIGDYNYVFSLSSRNLFTLQPGFDPARTLLLIDEAHNLPSRVADAYSHVARASDAQALLAELDHVDAPRPLLRAWESWTQLLSTLRPADSLDPALEADAEATLKQLGEQLMQLPLDYAALGPRFSEQLWQIPTLVEWSGDARLKKLLWCPREGELAFTCIDAAEAIGETLGTYGGVILASATLNPADAFAENCGLVPPAGETAPLDHNGRAPYALVRAETPWRAGAYDVAYDLRVDTSYQQRGRHQTTTAATVAALHAAARGPVVVFFPSYAYAESVQRTLDATRSPLRVALQPRLRDLAAQGAWVDESIALTDVLFLVLGSSFAESIDVLGGRISHAMIVGPALPEVNAIQRARLAEFSGLGRDAAARRVYQIPGMQKVNQALGRLVRAPGQHAKVLLHCRRFADIRYASLLAPEYQFGQNLLDDADLARWLEGEKA